MLQSTYTWLVSSVSISYRMNTKINKYNVIFKARTFYDCLTPPNNIKESESVSIYGYIDHIFQQIENTTCTSYLVSSFLDDVHIAIPQRLVQVSCTTISLDKNQIFFLKEWTSSGCGRFGVIPRVPLHRSEPVSLPLYHEYGASNSRYLLCSAPARDQI